MSLKSIRKRKSSITTTRKITSAMKLVASAKFSKALSDLSRSKELESIVRSVLDTAAAHWFVEKGSLMEVRAFRAAPSERGKVLLIILSSEQGLCGSFNENMMAMAARVVKESMSSNKSVKIFCIGRKGREKMHKVCGSIVDGCDISYFSFSDAISAMRSGVRMFECKNIEELVVVYSTFKSVLRQRPTSIRLLPMELNVQPPKNIVNGGAISCSDEDGVLSKALLAFLESRFFSLLKEHEASENGARVMAMNTATDNANDLIQKLELQYNRLRQNMVTKELIEIISGADSV
ncbi:ATP synthase F1 subunit gamma [Candidatus Hydrogenosomobacter endosymbioticus]|uniref:ATP synthase gamma chain n=1 Tax=Candidatus Hydrogenosomobacter endosymbioticus TaxID=2558174 RepID=A0ABN6L2M9_9PROT|nr:ATP synthase F1 subunit gamma [Candidatus Hydrogenosomobacter endosymbioticus]BDB96124.1 ATP synthase gamma chain [Candidatus Hydrogenosomobacter endosymbioticus]